MTPGDSFRHLPTFAGTTRSIADQNLRVGATIDDLIIAWAGSDRHVGSEVSQQAQRASDYAAMSDLIYGSPSPAMDDEGSLGGDDTYISTEAVQRLRLRQLMLRALTLRDDDPVLANENLSLIHI